MNKFLKLFKEYDLNNVQRLKYDVRALLITKKQIETVIQIIERITIYENQSFNDKLNVIEKEVNQLIMLVNQFINLFNRNFNVVNKNSIDIIICNTEIEIGLNKKINELLGQSTRIRIYMSTDDTRIITL